MKLAFSSNAYMHFSIEATIEKIASLGYAGIEILADVPHAWPAGLLEERKESIGKCLHQHGLAISNVNAFMMNAVADPRQPYWYPGWTDPDPHYRAIRREHTKRALKLARELGAPSITTEPGGRLSSEQTWERAAHIFYEELMPCVEMAEQLEVRLLIEPEPDLMIEKFEQYLEFMAKIDSPWVGLNFDVGHAYCVGEDPQDRVARMQTHTRHYHIEDIAATRVHRHLIPGRGAIDLPATLRAIHKTGYDGWLTVELYPYIDSPDEAAREAHRHMSKLLAGLAAESGWAKAIVRKHAMRAILQLLRLPNVFTAMADILLGFLFTHQRLEPWPQFALLLAASSLLYLAGMALNDLFDVEQDTLERPFRPIPSGRVTQGFARRLGFGMLAVGVGLGWVAGAVAGDMRPGAVATLLAAAVLLYDAAVKKTPGGPLVMGACRMFNVLLGMSVSSQSWLPVNWVAAGGIGLYITGVTIFARTEARPSSQPQLALGVAVLLCGIGLLASLPLWATGSEWPPISVPERWYVFWGLIGMLIGWRALRAVLDPRPPTVQAAVKSCIFSLVILDAGACLAVQDFYWGLVILALLVPTVLLGRWICST